MIIGNKTILRALNRSDADKILKWCNDPEIKHLTGTLFPVSDIEHEKWFQDKISDPINKMFGIEDMNKNFIGIIGIKNVDLINRSGELYIYIGEKEFWGKGYGSDAVKTFVSFCLNEMNMHRIYLSVFSYNKRAIRSYEKSGFKTEGVLKDAVFKGGRYHDKLIMGIINQNELKYQVDKQQEG